MDTRWAEELERSFGDGPPPPPATAYVAAGRAAVRRRRLAAGVASLAAVVVVGGIGWASLPGEPRAGAGQVATDPSPDAQGSAGASEEPTAESSASSQSPLTVREARDDELMLLDNGPGVTTTADGSALILRPGWRAEQVVTLRNRPRDKAWGIEMHNADGSEVQWVLQTYTPSTGGATWDAPSKRFARFDDWLAATWAAEQDANQAVGQPGGGVAPVATVVDGEVVGADGVTVLEVVMHPAEAAGYGPVGKQAAARLRLTDGTEAFALVAPWGATTVDAAVLDAPTMEAFLRHLADQNDSGEGLR